MLLEAALVVSVAAMALALALSPPLTVYVASSKTPPVGAFATAKAGKATLPENEVEM